MTARWSVRQFVALDLHGAAGSLTRRRLVLGEFVIGTACFLGLGLFMAAQGAHLWAAWLLGCGLSYGALAVIAVRLYPSRALRTELESVDIMMATRRYSVAQALLLVPGLVAAAAVVEALHSRMRPEGREEP